MQSGAAKKLGLAVLAWIVIWGLIFYDSLQSAASVWIVNDTFNHCFFVLPAVLYALWRQRGAILQQPPAYSVLGLLGVLAALVVYALGKAAYAELLQHLAIFGLIPAVALYLFGWRVIAIIWAPLAFILFSVPMGEEFFPQFQDITADMAVALLKVIGIPVYRDGLYISVANGNFVVAEACSGIRFFIACVVIGCAYAYLNFISKWRAFAFVVFSIVMPVVANGFRAFGIILIGHLTEMEHAAGADHLIYGWFFFAVVIVFLVMVGYWFSDGQRQWQSEVVNVHEGWHLRRPSLLLMASALPFVLALGVKIVVSQQQSHTFDMVERGLQPVSEQQVELEPWTPRYIHADAYRVGYDAANGVHLYQAIYFLNVEGRELISSFQRLFERRRWTLKAEYVQEVPEVGTITISHLTSISGHQRLMAHWFVVPGRIDSRASVIKLQQAINTLSFRSSGGAMVAVSMEFSDSLQAAQSRLLQALQESALELSQSVTSQ